MKKNRKRSVVKARKRKAKLAREINELKIKEGNTNAHNPKTTQL